MSDHVFVGRERELARLNERLESALAGSGQLMFVAGEAGSGKSALIREFARHAERAHPELVIAIGNCNAQVGIGDPYLPCREILVMLTLGGVESRDARAALSEENEARLQALMSRSIQILVEVGPDLVDVLVPGSKLLATVGKAVANKMGWMDELEQLARRRERAPAGAPMEQNRLFEQYTNFLVRLAAERPLVIIVDDLHWADAGSISLLFHLARRIESSRIMLIGSYRPFEIELGRDGARHPLEPVLNELQRYFGDITIDLGRQAVEERQRFVGALLDTEPNALDGEFRDRLYRHTEGNPLFTIELLRDMQERGALVLDEERRWIEASGFSWQELPARVEGVIEERLDRLSDQHREILDVASVEGSDFTAQVIARIEQLAERQLLQQLSHELARRHGLVRERGEIELRRMRLWRYEFAHALFQHYVYHQLGTAERRLLHGEVAQTLEALYADQEELIAVQLARHYLEAHDPEKAFRYLVAAGDAAARVYATTEARLHYDRALTTLDSLPETLENRAARVDVTIKLVSVSIFAADPVRHLERLHLVEPIARELPGPDGSPGDPLRLARVHYWMGRSSYLQGKAREAVGYYKEVLAVALESGDAELKGIPSSSLGQAVISQGRYDRALPLLLQSLEPLAQTANWIEWIRATTYTGIALAAHGRYTEALEYGDRALARALELKHLTSQANCHLLRGWIFFLGNDMEGMWREGNRTTELSLETGDLLALFVGYGQQAWADSRLGRHEAAARHLELNKETAERVRGGLILTDLFASGEVEIALNAGRTDEALALADKAVVRAQAGGNVFAEGLAHRFWALALARRDPDGWAEIETHLVRSIELLETGAAVVEAARTHVAWARLLRDRRAMREARRHLEQAAAIFGPAGFDHELEELRSLSAAPATPL